MLRDEKKEDDDWGINQCGRYVIDNTHNTRALKVNCSTLEGKNLKIKHQVGEWIRDRTVCWKEILG